MKNNEWFDKQKKWENFRDLRPKQSFHTTRSWEIDAQRVRAHIEMIMANQSGAIVDIGTDSTAFIERYASPTTPCVVIDPSPKMKHIPTNYSLLIEGIAESIP